ncbi:Transcription-coupled repair protein CSB/RAD26 (contains SNF2 family DNA-dependent ATPase domain) [Trachipleistophora hominis]|uniref:Transcription-coupled repair protein CSB/RAD26 (Contains SNF2 family DNA-dependent ATPase domain) n=1 Tax=Trachipleistophora hominis TaxID=72359 RepID=L7JUX9_TRAHO|nr:Transcription-coupled repair protein CSB/RAD26 (contains SNF2 family DNA-dependent ATPase domain) [Trachipleistophora hominis]
MVQMEKTRQELVRSLRLVDEMEADEKNEQNYDLHAKDGPESFVYLLGEMNKTEPDERFTRFVHRIRSVEKLYKDHFGVEDVESHLREEHVLIVQPKDEDEAVGAIYCPAYVYNFLLPFQQTALTWFCSLFMGKHGGILADEMGLGKTIQAIAFLSSLLHSNKIGGVLILCPTTLLEQWFLEIRRIYPFVRTIILHNSFIESIDKTLDQKIIDGRMGENFRKTIVVASYEGFKIFFNKIRGLNLDILILDEGHKIKNFNTQTFKYIKTYNCLTYILTGTPVQNNLRELWSLFNITNKHLLGSYTDFHEQFEDVILKGTRRKADKKEKENSAQRTAYLKSLIAPYILRRTKKGTNLPKKYEKIAFCPMTTDQISMYKEFIESKTVSDIIKGSRNVFYGLDVLRKITNHPSLYKKGVHGESGKMHMLAALLKKWYEGVKDDGLNAEPRENSDRMPMNKVLIFSQSLEMLSIIESFIASNKYAYLRMDGTTSLMERKRRLDMFTKKDYFIFFSPPGWAA